MELALGNYLTLRIPPGGTVSGGDNVTASDGWQEMRFQNFWIGRNVRFSEPGWPTKTHSFLPFGFSGAVISRQGDNIDANIVLPNSPISRAFLDQAVRERWLAVVRVVQIDNLDDPEVIPSMLYKYQGFVSSGGWTPTELSLSLNSILDAARTDIPVRSLHQDLVGDVPASANIALS